MHVDDRLHPVKDLPDIAIEITGQLLHGVRIEFHQAVFQLDSAVVERLRTAGKF